MIDYIIKRKKEVIKIITITLMNKKEFKTDNQIKNKTYQLRKDISHQDSIAYVNL